jgi:hypothetical protein
VLTAAHADFAQFIAQPLGPIGLAAGVMHPLDLLRACYVSKQLAAICQLKNGEADLELRRFCGASSSAERLA